MNKPQKSDQKLSRESYPRRDFVKRSATVAVTAAAVGVSAQGKENEPVRAFGYEFETADSLCHGPDWESLNPGYWQIKGNALRRRLTNVGDRARATGFPFHAANVAKKMATQYDPSLPYGIIYRREWNMAKDFSMSGDFVYRGDRPEPGPGDDPSWKMYRSGYGTMGLALGAKSLFESYNKIRNAVQIVYTDDGRFGLVRSGRNKDQKSSESIDVPKLKRGDKVTIRVEVEVEGGDAKIRATMKIGDREYSVSASATARQISGFVGVSGRGLIDFELSRLEVIPQANEALRPSPIECYACYPLGDSLKLVNDNWQVRFVSLFETDGSEVEIRIATEENPAEGWEGVSVAGRGKIVNHQWRRNTAVVEATLPANPAETNLFYTVWKDGVDVTADTRIGSGSTGPGTGMVGDVPSRGDYVGRLPRLVAPYKLCGLSCHAISSGLQQKTESGLAMLGGGAEWQFRDQPTVDAYRHFEDYQFQILVWEDDVWYMELVFYPPSTDDAYKVVKSSICGPTSRWQMMRHWNVINPGDHDYGMDDVKGPEQIAIRRVSGLGQDPTYMRRNFQIVHHLITGDEDVDPLVNPKKWRSWKMPNRDFTFVILDSRLWRSSQDTDIWDDQGWDEFKNLYDRTDPTRSLLGEEQFAWLQRLVATDSSPLICLTGINGMHTVWTGANYKGGAAGHIQGPFDQRDRVTADYAGWVKAGADRVLQLLGTRDGIVSVYGDVHNGCVMKNVEHGAIECSFGPIGRTGGRSVIPGFGRKMKDFDGRDIEVYALYHKTHASPDLERHAKGEPVYWNFLEMEFRPTDAKNNIGLRIRNMIDHPTEVPRGGGQLTAATSATGRPLRSRVPAIKTLANADVRFETVDGIPIRGTRSDRLGNVLLSGFSDIPPEEELIMTSHDGNSVESKIVKTQAV